ncbi:hypothetical protein E4P41_11370, partial [Geodermatophilus sp. DF01-2]
FQHGSVYWSAGTGAHAVTGAALPAYWARGSITGPLGFPTGDTTLLEAGGTAETETGFSGGSIYTTPGGGARLVLAAVDVQYRAAGGPSSAYGWPVSDSYRVSGGVRNDFENGQITG